jgi:hypothetical protein
MAFDDTLDNSTRPPTDWEAKDLAAAGIKGALSNIPFVGGSAGEMLALALLPPLARRRDNWFESLAFRLLELEGRVEGFTVDRLLEDEQFVSAVVQASSASLRSHQQEKLDALRNAVLNTALNVDIDVAEQQMFMSWVDQFTEWHLRVLDLFAAPREWLQTHERTTGGQSGTRTIVLESAWPELVGRREFYDQVVRDLNARGLLTVSQLQGMVSDMFGALTSPLANRFLRYITSPKK